MKKITLIAVAVFLTFLSATQAQEARQILDATGVTGGLVVAIGCDSPELLAGLRAGDSYLVHGLDSDPGKVADARDYLQNNGLYGPITVSRWEDSQLPYADNVVNVIVARGKGQVTGEEITRVLAPGGVALMPEAGDQRSPLSVDTIQVDRRAWSKLVKPWPKEIDDWTHYLYDASNNAVSRDTAVAPPRGLQWTCGPEYARSHEHFGSVSAMVSTAGRVFYIIDEGPISSVFLPPNWKLVARDAFNGVLLWQRPIANWESQLRGFRSGPPEIGRRLIANGDHIYVTLGYGQSVTVLDAATGDRCRVLEGTEGAREMLSRDGVLYVLADDMTAADHDDRKKWINETAPALQGYQFPKRAIPMYGKQRIVALEIATGKSLWKKEFDVAGEIMPATLAVAEGRVCFQTGSHVVCLDAEDSRELWRSDRPVARSRFSWSTPTLVMHEGVVLTVDRVATAGADDAEPQQGSKWIIDNTHQSKRQDAELVAVSLEDGKELWRAPCFENYDTQLDIFVIDDVVWVGDLRHKGDVGFTEGRDLRTGKVVVEIPNNLDFYSLQMGHHRCYRNKATVRYLLLGRDGIEFVDPRTGTGEGHWWVRGTCQYGIMPANGLIYVPQHSCGCHPQEKLIGFNVLAPEVESKGGDVEEAKSQVEVLERGPAYAQIGNRKSKIEDSTDWPTYRRDVRRSGFQDLATPREVTDAWTAKLVAPVTAPVVAGEMVFVAETERHALYALSAKDGKKRWTFVADGRIDSPPTVSGGLCLFGTRNGFVYCLRAGDGEMAWRFRAVASQRLILSYEQLESAWPVHGSVLVDDTSGTESRVYFAAGRSSHLDGGIRLYSLDRDTGKVLRQADVTMTAGAEDGDGIIAQRALPDVLSLQNGNVFMRDLRLDKDLAFVPSKIPHLYAPGGFLDNTWWHRTYWIYGTTMMSGYGGWPRIGNVVPSGRLLVFDGGEVIYGYGRMTYQAGAGHVRPDAAKDYRLFAEVLAPTPKPQPKPEGRKKRPRGPSGRREVKWSTSLPFVAKAIVLAQDALLVAGGNSLVESAERHGPGTFWIASRKDGTKLAECKLPAAPVLDGMAFTDTGVFVSTIDGSVVCCSSTE